MFIFYSWSVTVHTQKCKPVCKCWKGLLGLTLIFTLCLFLPPATKLGQGYNFTGVCHSVNGGGVWSQGGVWSRGVSAPGDVWSQGGLLLGGLVPGVLSAPGGGVCSRKGGAWWRPPRDAHCCGHSYWNAFLLIQVFSLYQTLESFCFWMN